MAIMAIMAILAISLTHLPNSEGGASACESPEIKFGIHLQKTESGSSRPSWHNLSFGVDPLPKRFCLKKILT
jgi:hypothetical protein